MEEQNLKENQIINNQVVQKKKIIGKWTFFIIPIEIWCIMLNFGVLFIFCMAGDARGPSCSIGEVIGNFFMIIFYASPFLSLFLFFKKDSEYNNITYPIITFLVGIIIPFFFFLNFLSNYHP
jgi:hypothetical protein